MVSIQTHELGDDVAEGFGIVGIPIGQTGYVVFDVLDSNVRQKAFIVESKIRSEVWMNGVEDDFPSEMTSSVWENQCELISEGISITARTFQFFNVDFRAAQSYNI